jgi:hypothetical protein
MDKSTVFSILPKRIEETKHTISPGTFILEPGTYEKPYALTVGTSSWWKELDPEQPLLEIPVPSLQVADSIVKDYCNGILGCNMNDMMPGLFFLPGEVSVEKLKSEHNPLLDTVKDKQINWFRQLVKMADALWARTNGNPLSIGDDMRLAARELGMDSKEWLGAFQTVEIIRCVACGQMRNPQFPVCPNCKAVIDVEKAKALKIQFAQ